MKGIKDFRNTAASREIRGALNMISEQAIIGVISAAVGVGKREALKAWRREEGRAVRHVWIESQLLQSARPLLGAMAEALQVAPQPGKSLAISIAARLVSDPVMVIVSQSDGLRLDALQKLWGIWQAVGSQEAPGCRRAFPLALIGDETMGSLLAQPRLQALRSRVKLFVRVEGLPPEEIGMIVEKDYPDIKLDAALLPELYEMTHRGSYRWLENIMNHASLLDSRRPGGTVTRKILRASANYLAGVKEG